MVFVNTGQTIKFLTAYNTRLIRLLCVCMLLLPFYSLAAQQDVDFTRANFKDKAKALKKAKQNVRIGYLHYQEERFPLAINYLEKAHEFNSNNAELNYKLGVCYLQTYYKHQSLDLLQKAYQLDEEVSKDIHYLLGRGYQLNYKFDKAISEYQEHYKSLDVEEKKIWKPQVDKRILECKFGKYQLANPIQVQIENIGKNINTRYPDYRPFITANDSMMLFTSRRPNTTGKQTDPADYEYYEDIYMSEFKNGKWQKPYNLHELNTMNHDAIVGMTPDASQIIYFDGKKNNGDLFISYKKGMHWSTPWALSEHINTPYRESSASLTEDGDTLYFVSDRPEDSFGGKDIFWSVVQANGNFGPAQNLGSVINTEFDEEGVLLHKSGKALFFSSQGHSSMGGYDIFKSVKDENGQWTKPQNLGYPLNTPDDDVFFAITESEEHGYIASARDNAYGSQDIYKISFVNEANPLTDLVPDDEATDTAEIFANLKPDSLLNREAESFIVEKILEDTSENVLVEALFPDTSGVLYAEAEIVDSLVTEEVIDDVVEDEIEEDEIVVEEVVQPPIEVRIEVVDLYADKGVTTVYPVDFTNDMSFTLPPGSDMEVEVEVEDVAVTYGQARLVNQQIIRDVIASESYSEKAGIKNYSDMLLSEDRFKGQYNDDVPNTSYFVKNVPEDKENDRVVETKVDTTPVVTKEMMSHKVNNIAEKNEPGDNLYTEENDLMNEGHVIDPDQQEDIPGGSDVYTIQLGAYRYPVAPDYFKNLDNVREVYCKDGLYRYFTGTIKGKQLAMTEQGKIARLGYNDAFIIKIAQVENKKNEAGPGQSGEIYTIQLMALEKKMDDSYFEGINELEEYTGNRGIIIYATGKYTGIEQAREELARVKSLGYKRAHITSVSIINETINY